MKTIDEKLKEIPFVKSAIRGRAATEATKALSKAGLGHQAWDKFSRLGKFRKWFDNLVGGGFKGAGGAGLHGGNRGTDTIAALKNLGYETGIGTQKLVRPGTTPWYMSLPGLQRTAGLGGVMGAGGWAGDEYAKLRMRLANEEVPDFLDSPKRMLESVLGATWGVPGVQRFLKGGMGMRIPGKAALTAMGPDAVDAWKGVTDAATGLGEQQEGLAKTQKNFIHQIMGDPEDENSTGMMGDFTQQLTDAVGNLTGSGEPDPIAGLDEAGILQKAQELIATNPDFAGMPEGDVVAQLKEQSRLANQGLGGFVNKMTESQKRLSASLEGEVDPEELAAVTADTVAELRMDPANKDLTDEDLLTKAVPIAAGKVKASGGLGDIMSNVVNMTGAGEIDQKLRGMTNADKVSKASTAFTETFIEDAIVEHIEKNSPDADPEQMASLKKALTDNVEYMTALTEQADKAKAEIGEAQLVKDWEDSQRATHGTGVTQLLTQGKQTLAETKKNMAEQSESMKEKIDQAGGLIETVGEAAKSVNTLTGELTTARQTMETNMSNMDERMRQGMHGVDTAWARAAPFLGSAGLAAGGGWAGNTVGGLVAPDVEEGASREEREQAESREKKIRAALAILGAAGGGLGGYAATGGFNPLPSALPPAAAQLLPAASAKPSIGIDPHSGKLAL